MKTINNTQTRGSRSVKTYLGMLSVLALFVSIGLTSQASAYTQLTTQLDLGAKGANVSYLQTFLADNAAIYPEHLITGYYGSLTRAAVQRFQATYGIVSSGTAASTGYGRVGPSTLAKINSLIAAGGWTTSDISGPLFYNIVQTQNYNSGTVTFSTSESVTARVVYNTTPLMFNEGDVNSNGFGPIGGLSVASPNGMGTSHSIQIPNLQSNTTYYYTVIATDASGNVSVIGPNSTFHTF